MVGEAVKRSRRKPVRILVISRKVFAQLVSTELGALNRESVLSRLPGIRGERYRPLQCVHFCSRLYVASPKGYPPSFPPWWISILPIEAAISFHVLCPCPGDNLTNNSWKHERMRCGSFSRESYRMDLAIWKRKFLKVNNGIGCVKFSCRELAREKNNDIMKKTLI